MPSCLRKLSASGGRSGNKKVERAELARHIRAVRVFHPLGLHDSRATSADSPRSRCTCCVLQLLLTRANPFDHHLQQGRRCLRQRVPQMNQPPRQGGVRFQNHRAGVGEKDRKDKRPFSRKPEISVLRDGRSLKGQCRRQWWQRAKGLGPAVSNRGVLGDFSTSPALERKPNPRKRLPAPAIPRSLGSRNYPACKGLAAGGPRGGCVSRCLRIRAITAGSSMQAMIFSAAPQCSQRSMSRLKTCFSRCAQRIARCRSAGVARSAAARRLPRPLKVTCDHKLLFGAHAHLIRAMKARVGLGCQCMHLSIWFGVTLE